MTGPSPRTFNFGAGNPDPGVFPSQDLGEAARRALTRMGTELAHYPEARGLPELRARRAAALRAQPPRPPAARGDRHHQRRDAGPAAQRPGPGPPGRHGDHGGVRVRRHHPRLQAVRTAAGAACRSTSTACAWTRSKTILEQQAASGKTSAFIYTTASYQNPTGTSQPLERRQKLLELGAQIPHPDRRRRYVR